MIVLSGCEAGTDADNRTTHTSVFSWNREIFDNDPSVVMTKLSDYQIDRIYQGLYPADLEREKTAELVSGLKKLGIETVYLAGDPDWNSADDVIRWTLEPLLSYNKGIGKAAQINTICYDNEFYSGGRDDEKHFADYVAMMESVSDKAHDSGLYVIYCLPYWLPMLSEDLFKQLIAQADEISIMNYDVGREADNLTDIYAWCTEAGMKVESIFETQPGNGDDVPENITYNLKGKNAVIEAGKDLKSQYDGLSIAYHHLTSLLLASSKISN